MIRCNRITVAISKCPSYNCCALCCNRKCSCCCSCYCSHTIICGCWSYWRSRTFRSYICKYWFNRWCNIFNNDVLICGNKVAARKRKLPSHNSCSLCCDWKYCGRCTRYCNTTIISSSWRCWCSRAFNCYICKCWRSGQCAFKTLKLVRTHVGNAVAVRANVTNNISSRYARVIADINS